MITFQIQKIELKPPGILLNLLQAEIIKAIIML
jgi:hypothetical protein